MQMLKSQDSIIKKYIVNDEQEYIQIFEEMIKRDYNDVERFIDIEFPFTDGNYQSDSSTDLSISELLAVDTTKYRKREGASVTFPSEYPCIVLFAYDDDYDRTGSTHFEMLEFVYLSDFDQ